MAWARFLGTYLLFSVGCVAAHLTFVGCGGGSSEGEPKGTLNLRVLWQQQERSSRVPALKAVLDRPQGIAEAGFGPELPDAVRTVQFVFQTTAANGSSCCVAITREAANIGPVFDPETGRRSILLDELPPGPATITILGFPSNVAPAAPGVFAPCATDPPEVGIPCASGSLSTPSYESEPTSVRVSAGTDVNVTDVRLPSRPFLVPDTVGPAPDSSEPNPIGVRFTVADAVSGIDPDSIETQLTPAGTVVGGSSAERSPCDDAGPDLCSSDGQLGVRGYHVLDAGRNLSVGPAQLRIRSDNLDVPPRSLDVQFGFDVRDGVETPTITPPPGSTSTPVASATTVPPLATPTATPVASATPTSVRTVTHTPTVVSTATFTPTPTQTATPDVGVFAGSAAGFAGERVRLDVFLERANATVVAVETEIEVAGSLRIVAIEGEPDCVLNPKLAKVGCFSFLPIGCTPGLDCEMLRAVMVSVVDETPIPAGTLLYSCNVDIDDDALPGGVQVPCVRARYSPPAPAPVPAPAAECFAGSVVVLP